MDHYSLTIIRHLRKDLILRSVAYNSAQYLVVLSPFVPSLLFGTICAWRSINSISLILVASLEGACSLQFPKHRRVTTTMIGNKGK